MGSESSAVDTMSSSSIQELKLEQKELKQELKVQKLAFKVDNSLTGGDQAIGEEILQQELSKDDIESYKAEHEAKYGKMTFAVNWGRVLASSISGALVCAIICLLWFHKTAYSDYFQWVMGGMCLGGSIGLLGMAGIQGYQYYKAETNDPFQIALNQRRATLRRMEQEAVERHDEFVYYDAGKEHGRLYTLLCCPSFGKITSRRIMYSAPQNMAHWMYYCIPTCLSDTCCKKVETMDYKLIDDVTVEQNCCDVLMGTGSIIMHCRGSYDTSIVLEERERLMKALQARDLVLLKQAARIVRQLDNKEGLEEEYDEVKKMIKSIEDQEKVAAQAAGTEWIPTFALDPEDANTAQKIRVINVPKPFPVADDLSYRITVARGKSHAKL